MCETLEESCSLENCQNPNWWGFASWFRVVTHNQGPEILRKIIHMAVDDGCELRRPILFYDQGYHQAATGPA